jgi:hypothetical protein
MAIKYHDAIHDEINFLFDVLQNNGIDNIAKEAKVSRSMVRDTLSRRFAKLNGSKTWRTEKNIGVTAWRKLQLQDGKVILKGEEYTRQLQKQIIKSE